MRRVFAWSIVRCRHEVYHMEMLSCKGTCEDAQYTARQRAFRTREKLSGNALILLCRDILGGCSHSKGPSYRDIDIAWRCGPEVDNKGLGHGTIPPCGAISSRSIESNEQVKYRDCVSPALSVTYAYHVRLTRKIERGVKYQLRPSDLRDAVFLLRNRATTFTPKDQHASNARCSSAELRRNIWASGELP